MSNYSTRERPYILSTPLGEDELLIQEFTGNEHLSKPFEFTLLVCSERDDIQPEELVGKRATLRLQTADDERHWTGMMSSFTRLATHRQQGTAQDSMTTYRCEVVPWLWMLLLNEDSRIYQNKAIPDIVESIFSDFQYKDYELHLTGQHPPLVYCTQYRETHFHFIARLLERAGIFYYFRHEPDAEKLILTDNLDGCPMLNTPDIRYGLPGNYQEGDTISTIGRHELIRSGRIIMRDFNFENPAMDLETRIDSLVRIGENGNFERFIHPGGYTERSEGERLVRLLMEAEEAAHAILEGTGNARLMTAGYKFQLEDHPDDTLNRSYLIAGVEHKGNNNLDGDSGATYDNAFAVMPDDIPYREPQKTPKPKIYGIQTAIVAGPAGEEIYTEKYGRVKIHLLWDRWGGTDDKASCWARVMQTSAGNRWGTFSVPRIGMEVAVVFENGDPDCPVVVGSFYNGANMPPYELPANMTRSGVKTLSSKGGTGFNEMRFEDKKGDEEIFVHAEKDLQIQVKNDVYETIGGQRSLTINEARLEWVKKDRHLKVDRSRFTSIKQDDNLTVSGNFKLQARQGIDVFSGADTAHETQEAMHIKAGTQLVLEAGVEISIKAGPSSITLGPGGVTVDGPLVRLNCGGSPLSAMSPERPDPVSAAIAAIDAVSGKISDAVQQAQAQALRDAAAAAQPFCAVCEAARAALAAMGA